MLKKSIALAALTFAVVAGPAEARDQIRVVGSSTVFPFATAVAERFGKTSDFKTPVIESTGSGGGLKLFCAGVGIEHPDITNSSRRIKASEVEKCDANGVGGITEVKIGFDGIVVANSRESEPVELSLRQLWLALAKDVPEGSVDGGAMIPNPYETWSDIDPALPAVKIEVLGPPPTSGTRDAFVELAMEGGCKTFSTLKALKTADKSAYKATCHAIREDGKWIDAGENDNLIVQKLDANPGAFGVFGFSFLDQNSDMIQGGMIDGVEPTFENISAQDYPVSRSLFFYVKNAHVDSIPGMSAYIAEFTSEQAWGPEGYLADKGLIPLPDDERQSVRDSSMTLTPLSM